MTKPNKGIWLSEYAQRYLSLERKKALFPGRLTFGILSPGGEPQAYIGTNRSTVQSKRGALGFLREIADVVVAIADQDNAAAIQKRMDQLEVAYPTAHEAFIELERKRLMDGVPQSD